MCIYMYMYVYKVNKKLYVYVICAYETLCLIKKL